MKVTCVIPAWNEASFLAEVINNLRELVDHVVVVDDGSVDNTKEIANDLSVDVLRHPINRGQGAALKTGTLWALDQGADIIVHFDADGQFRPEDIAPVIEPIRRGEADIVFGSRFLEKASKIPFIKRSVIMPLARLVNRLFFNIRLSDPQSGFRAMSRQAAQKIDWQQDEMAHCSEILIAAHQGNFKIAEVPIVVIYKDFGQRFSGGLRILYDSFLAKLNSHY